MRGTKVLAGLSVQQILQSTYVHIFRSGGTATVDLKRLTYNYKNVILSKATPLLLERPNQQLSVFNSIYLQPDPGWTSE